MKRQIKFRGKVVHDDPMVNPPSGWVDGFYYQDLDKGKIAHFIFNCPMTWQVREETIGQFTGLVDKNGKEIYEGDIVQLDYITTSGRHRIGLSFEVKWCTQGGCWVGWDGFVENAIQQTHKMFVVKGNIHDNPELIEVNKES